LGKFLAWLRGKGIADLKKVGKAELKDYAQAVSDKLEISVSYVCANIRAVKLFFRYLKKTNVVLYDFSVVLKEPKQPKILPKEPLTDQAVRQMLEAPDLRTPLGIRDRAILETFYSTGIRLQEMVNLTLLDLDLEKGFLFVREGKWKKDRMVPLGKYACLFIKTYLEGSRNLLLAKNKQPLAVKTNRVWIGRRGIPLEKMDIGFMVRHYRKKAGIEKEVTPHSFRRTLAVELIRNECDFLAVKEILGHSKSETTLRYCALSGVDLREALRKCHPREADEPEDVIPKIMGVV
jgi:integrase/recombinase XerD